MPMPIRFLRPGIVTSRRINSCSWMAQSLFTRLITVADDYGRYEADALQLARVLFPMGDPKGRAVPEKTVEALLEELASLKAIALYTHEGKRYLQMMRWQDGVRSKSKCPRPPAGVWDLCKHLLTYSGKCAQMLADADGCSQMRADASPSSSSSSSSSIIERERGEASPGDIPAPTQAVVEASRHQWGVLNTRVIRFEVMRQNGELSDVQLVTLKKMHGALDEIQRRQARGDFRILDLATFEL